MNLTRVVGCLMPTHELCFVRLETEFISIAFESLETVVLYVRVLDDTEQDTLQDKKLLKALLGPLFRKESFGVHRLRGGDFEVVISSDPFSRLMVEADSQLTKSNVSGGDT